jgi:arginyl-tRNA synthetase
MEISHQLSLDLTQALETLYGHPEKVVLSPTRKDFEGDFTFVVFGLSATLKKNPMELATALGEHLKQQSSIVADYNVVKGFLNISLKDSFLLQSFGTWSKGDNRFSLPSKNTPVLVEFSSPNTNKPLHLGHLRNNFLGHATSKILAAAGYTVTKACLVNDRGIHICKSMVAYIKEGKGETPATSGLKGDHLAGKYYVIFDSLYKAEINELIAKGLTEDEAKKNAPIMLEAQNMLKAWEDGDPEIMELWQKMNQWVYEGFNATYKKIGVDFDKTYYESDTYLLGKDIIEEGLEKSVFFKKEDNSIWIDLTEEGMDQKLVLRGDGTSVYITQDLGTTDLKFRDYKSEKSIWVVGNEQDYHFKVLFAIMKRLGRTYADGCFHLSYGMVDLPSGKMKSREGTVVDADELYQEMLSEAETLSQDKGKTKELPAEEAQKLYRMLALGALKYYLLKVEPKKRMLFNPEESIDFQGNTGPFIQYTHARIKSILRKASAVDFSLDFEKISLQKEERELSLLLFDFQQILHKSAEEYAPSQIANYLFELAKTFNAFYAQHSVVNETDSAIKAFRLNLVDQVAQGIKTGMDLLGIEVPEQM